MYLHKVYNAAATCIAVGQNKTCCQHASSGALSDNRWSNERLKISKHTRDPNVCSWWHSQSTAQIVSVYLVSGEDLSECCNNTDTVRIA